MYVYIYIYMMYLCMHVRKMPSTVFLHDLILHIGAMCISRLSQGLARIGHLVDFEANGISLPRQAQVAVAPKSIMNARLIPPAGCILPFRFPKPQDVSALVPCGNCLHTGRTTKRVAVEVPAMFAH